MGGTFVVTLREGFEAALILGIVYTYLDKLGAGRQYPIVTLGAVFGFVASVLLGVAVTLLSGPLLDLGPDLIAALVLFVAVAVLTWHGWWMRQHARAVRGEVHRRIEEAECTGRVWILALIAFTAVFREGAETVLFLWGLFTQAASVSAWAGLTGGLLGLLTAGGLGWAIFRGGRRLPLRHFFAVTSVLLLFLAAGLFSAGVGRLQGLGLLPLTPPLWDTSAVLADNGFVGGFLNGLVGYRARPSAFEAAAYALYLVVAGALLFVPDVRLRLRRRAGATASGEGVLLRGGDRR